MANKIRRGENNFTIYNKAREMMLVFGRHRPRRKLRIEFTFSLGKFRLKGFDMTANVLITQTPFLVIGNPVISDGVTPSQATLSSTSYISSDLTVFTVAPDPSTPNQAIVTIVGAGSATLSETATATETDKATETISGTATIVVTAVAPPPPPAASLVFSFGLPASDIS